MNETEIAKLSKDIQQLISRYVTAQKANKEKSDLKITVAYEREHEYSIQMSVTNGKSSLWINRSTDTLRDQLFAAAWMESVHGV